MAFDDTVRIRRIDAAGVSMRIAVAGPSRGDAPDIVWIPGGDAPAEYYLEQWARFGAYRCISYDPRGVRETTAPPPPWTIEEMAADCAAVIEATCDGAVILTGLSMGGLLTQAVACARPDLVRLAIPMGTAAYIDGFTRDWMQAEIDMRREGRSIDGMMATCHYAAFAYPTAALGDPEVWARVKAAYSVRFGERAPEDLIAQWQACLDYDGRAALRRCEVPMHVVAFAQDMQTPPAMCREVSDLARRGVFHEVPGLGHVSHARHAPDTVASLLHGIIAGAAA